ncbi:MAG TPA: alpha/beta hydrolase [Thermoleophilaceae bacterium]
MEIRRPLLIGAAAAALALPAAPAHAKTRQSVAIGLDAGATQRVDVCGAKRTASLASRGQKVHAPVTLSEARGLRWGGRRARLIVDRCEGGRWQQVESRRFGTRGAYRRTRSYRLPIGTASSADLRVRATVEGDKHRRPAKSRTLYLRVGRGEIVDVPVAFDVDNVNRTAVPCPSDGKRYEIAGHLMAPRAVLDAGRAVTVFLHGIEISDAYFRYRGVPGYDFQGEMAELGHALIVVDRLGHGESDLPPAGATCVGAQADIAHQIVDLARAGSYRLGGGAGRAFGKAALAGHSFGSYMAEVSAMSFNNQDALVLNAFAAEGIDLALLADRQSRGEAGSCQTGSGFEKRPGAPTGYAYLWPDRDIWNADTFGNAEPRIAEDSEELRERSPCGDINSSVPAAFTEPGQYNRITSPVVMTFGSQDKLFPPPAGQNHRTFFTGSSDVTLYEVDGGHTLMLQRTAPEFRQKLSDWLRARGF